MVPSRSSSYAQPRENRHFWEPCVVAGLCGARGKRMTQTPLDYQTPQPQPGLALRIPAILLIVFGGLTIAAIVLDFLSRIIAGSAGFHFTFGFHVGPPESAMCFNALSVVLLVIMMVGAIQMLRLRNYPLAMTAAILAVVPFTAT